MASLTGWSTSPSTLDHRNESAWPGEPPRQTYCPGLVAKWSPNLAGLLDALAGLAHLPIVTFGSGKPKDLLLKVKEP